MTENFTPDIATPNDPPRDFCLWTYTPPRPPTDGDWRGVNLLLRAAELTGGCANIRALIATLRANIGPFHSVWGVKWDRYNLFAELYFYDYDRFGRTNNLHRVADAVADHLDIKPALDDALPYFMFSVDLPLPAISAPHRVDTVDVYFGNPGSSVSSGICYARHVDRFEMKNFYFFFDRAESWDDAQSKIANSAFIPHGDVTIDEIVPPFLRDCEIIVAANKRDADAVYASRISARTLLQFMEWRDYPAALTHYLSENLDRFDHLLFDVGFDYRWANGRVEIEKSSFYNVF